MSRSIRPVVNLDRLIGAKAKWLGPYGRGQGTGTVVGWRAFEDGLTLVVASDESGQLSEQLLDNCSVVELEAQR